MITVRGDATPKEKRRTRCFNLIKQRGSISPHVGDPDLPTWREFEDEGIVKITDVGRWTGDSLRIDYQKPFSVK